jgi:imidazolonepropionase-like amidohydrolase
MRRAFCAVVMALLFALPARAATPTVTAIEGATVWTEPGKKLENATIVVRDGKIAAIGAGAAVKVPAGARRIDAKGQVVTAGFVDAYTTLGLSEILLEPGSTDGSLEETPAGDQIHAAFRVVDAYNTQSVAVPIARTGGVTSVISVPTGGLVGGAAAWMSLVDTTRAKDATLASPVAMQLTLGSAARATANGSRGMAVERARELLDDARAYARRKNDYERNQTRRFAASRLDLEALAPVLQGRVPLVIAANRAADILSAIALAGELGIRVIIAGGAEAWQVAPELARAKVPVALDPTFNLPASFDTLHVRDDAAKLLVDAGVTVLISTLGDGSVVRNLRQLCGVAIANGLAWDAALAAVTTAPAAAFGGGGAGGRGKLAVGAAADLVVWSGDPFELSTRALYVFIAGVEQPLRTRQTLLLERYRKL